MPHLSELHGAATHLAVVAVPVYLIVLLCRRADLGGPTLAQVEHWVVGCAVLGTVAAGVTGLLVWGQAQTTLRGTSFRVGTVHFWLGIALTAVVLAVAAWRTRKVIANHHTHGRELVVGGVVALVAVLAQGYLGGRMTYHQGVGVDAGGQFAQTATGGEAFSQDALGCASCHGDRAQGLRGPRLAGGVDLREFRSVHGHGLFPPSVVTDKDFAAIDAWLRTLAPSRAGGD